MPCVNYEDILASEHIEGVVLAVPAPMHCEMALKAFEANKHVFVEKPLAMNVREAVKMIESKAPKKKPSKKKSPKKKSVKKK